MSYDPNVHNRQTITIWLTSGGYHGNVVCTCNETVSTGSDVLHTPMAVYQYVTDLWISHKHRGARRYGDAG